MALGGAAWRKETRAWRRAMLKTPRPNTVGPMRHNTAGCINGIFAKHVRRTNNREGIERKIENQVERLT